MHRQLSNSLGGIWALDNGTVYVADVGNHRVDPAVLLDDFDLLNQPYLLKIWAGDEQQANHYIGKALQLSLNSEQLLFPGHGESLETQDV